MNIVQPSIRKRASIRVVKLGLFFFLLFTSFSSFNNIVTHIYQQENLPAIGPLNLIVCYSMLIISTLFAPFCSFSFKLQLFLAAIAYSINMSSGIVLPYIQNHTMKYVFVSFGAGIGGLSAGFLWVSQGGYMRQICKGKHNKGYYTGIFQIIRCSTNLTAGIITTFFLGFFQAKIYFITITFISLMSAVYCLTFLENIKQESQNSMKKMKLNLSQLIKFYPKMIPILLIIAIDGISFAICSNQVLKLIPQSQKNEHLDKKVGLVTIFIGLGSIFGGYFSGVASDTLKLRITGDLVLLFYAFSILITYLATLINLYWFVCLVGFIWGFEVNFLQGWTTVVCLKLFKGKLQAFAINKQLFCLFFCLFEAVVLLTKNNINFNIMLPLIALITIPCYALMNRLPLKEDKLQQNLFEKSILSQNTSQYSQDLSQDSSIIYSKSENNNKDQKQANQSVNFFPNQ